MLLDEIGWQLNKSLFVSASQDGTHQIMISHDSINWIPIKSPLANNFQCVTYGNGIFVAVSYDGGFNQIMTSSDGITWTAQISPARPAYLLQRSSCL